MYDKDVVLQHIKKEIEKMTKFKSIISKSWVYCAAAALIIGSSSVMAFALDNNVPEKAAANVVPIAAAVQQNTQVPSYSAELKTPYTVIDNSKNFDDLREKIKLKLSYIQGITTEQIEQRCNEIIANMTPAEKDISAEQAAAYAANILTKAYNVDFTGYIAEASFSRSPIPNTDSWSVVFRAPQEIQDRDKERTKSYFAGVDSVKGTMQYASFFDDSFDTVRSKNLKDTAWKDTAVQAILKVMPENVSINTIRVVMATPETGVSVVCELSDGSALAVRLVGENMEAATYVFFPNGYDGSMDDKPVLENGLG